MKTTKSFFDGVREGFKNPGYLLSAVITTVLLFFIFIIGIGFIAIISKIMKKSYLDLKKEKNTETYWTECPIKSRKKEDYFKLF